MRIVILATEASGDFLGSELIKAIRIKKKNVIIKGIGGPLMINSNFKSWVNISKFNAIGIYEVLIRIFKFIKLINFTEKKIREFQPDIIISIDSPSFNYRLLKKLNDLKRKKTKFYHYVAPTVWAWKSYRAKLFANLYHKLFVLFEFEKKYFVKHKLKTLVVGHQAFYNIKPPPKKKKKIIFLLGSRTSEIKNNINEFSLLIENTISNFSDFSFYILTFKDHLNFFKDIKSKFKNIKIITYTNQKQKIMSESFFAVAASGTVTLELAKFNTPMIVVYRTHFITKLIIKLLVKVKYACLINIYFDKLIIPEFLFNDFSYKKILPIFSDFLENKLKRNEQIKNLKAFSSKMLIKNKNPAEIIVNSIF